MRTLIGMLFLFVFLHILLAGEDDRYWVLFKDKDQTSAANISLKPATLLSEKALQRRQLRTASARLSFSDLPPSEHYIKQLEDLGVSIHQKSHWLNAVSCYLNNADKNQLEKLEFVRQVFPVKTYRRAPHLTNASSPSFYRVADDQFGPSFNQNAMLGIPAAHAAGLHGEDVLIALFDTGFTLEHEVFDHIQIVDTWDFIYNDPDVGNDEGDLSTQHNHGSEVLAVLAGFKSGELIGPAYGARFLLAKTEDLRSETHLEEDNWVAAAEWAERAGADIISTSVGYDYSVGYSYEDMDGNTAIITRAADLAAQKGVAVFCAAGNEGLTAWKYIAAPADGDSVVAVGGVRPDGSYWPSSSQGPTYDGRLKPDLVAQAQDVYAIKPGTLNEYQYVNGTSYACPLVTGAAAVLLSEMPFLTPIALYDSLKYYASQFNNPDNFVGYGLVDMDKVIVYILDKPGIHVLAFTGSPGPGRNTLNWTVDREIGNAKWLIRKREGTATYQMLAEIESNPSTTGLQTYTYVDNDINSGQTFSYYLFALMQSGTEVFADSLTINSLEPTVLSLVRNYPNPFNEKTRLVFGLTTPQRASLAIYTIQGQLVKTLIDNQLLSAEYHQIIWDATNNFGKKVSSGNYYVRLKTDLGERILKILLLK